MVASGLHAVDAVLVGEQLPAALRVGVVGGGPGLQRGGGRGRILVDGEGAMLSAVCRSSRAYEPWVMTGPVSGRSAVTCSPMCSATSSGRVPTAALKASRRPTSVRRRLRFEVRSISSAITVRACRVYVVSGNAGLCCSGGRSVRLGMPASSLR
ncbi:hypothetical protein MBT84_29510 [Streptomyces sp. MBT84]|nr:hypothetical protein [Streptomyces sp. MBT84]